MPVHPKIEERLRKLWALAQDSDSAECRTARKLYEHLLRKYDLSPDDAGADPAAWHVFRYCQGDKMIAARIITCFGWKATVGDKRCTIRVQCTREELRMLRDLYNHARDISRQKKADLRREHQSFVLGYLDRAFPAQTANAKCPRCGRDDYNYSPRRYRYICGYCGHRGRKVHVIDGDPDAYLEGIRRGAIALPGNRLPEGEGSDTIRLEARS